MGGGLDASSGGPHGLERREPIRHATGMARQKATNSRGRASTKAATPKGGNAAKAAKAAASPRPSPARSAAKGGAASPRPSVGPGSVTVAREAQGRERTLIEHDRLPLPIACALDGLARHRAAGEPLDKVVSSIARERHLGPRERRATADLAFSWARHATAVERAVAAAVKAEGGVAPRARQKDLASLCLAALAAGLDDATAGAASLPGFLRALVEDAAAGAITFPVSLPGWLERALVGAHGDAIIAALAKPARPDLAVDVRVMVRDDVIKALGAAGVVAEASPRCDSAVRVPRGGLALRKLPGAVRRAAWPMDEGSQLVAAAVSARAGERVLDLCAGGGGKARVLASTGAAIVAADIDGGRLARSVVGVAGVTAVVADGLKSPFADDSFDRVLVDAPCSGTGTLRRAPDLALRLDERDLPGLVELQRSLLGVALKKVRPGGRVVYATCSLLPQENDGVVDAVIAGRTDVKVVSRQTLVPPDSDGFFIAVLSRADR